jgi:hypothetical protein
VNLPTASRVPAIDIEQWQNECFVQKQAGFFSLEPVGRTTARSTSSTSDKKKKPPQQQRATITQKDWDKIDAILGNNQKWSRLFDAGYVIVRR